MIKLIHRPLKHLNTVKFQFNGTTIHYLSAANCFPYLWVSVIIILNTYRHGLRLSERSWIPPFQNMQNISLLLLRFQRFANSLWCMFILDINGNITSHSKLSAEFFRLNLSPCIFYFLKGVLKLIPSQTKFIVSW